MIKALESCDGWESIRDTFAMKTWLFYEIASFFRDTYVMFFYYNPPPGSIIPLCTLNNLDFFIAQLKHLVFRKIQGLPKIAPNVPNAAKIFRSAHVRHSYL